MAAKYWESLETMFNNHLFHKHLIKACLAAVFAIGLTACSSSSDTSSTTPPPPPDPGPTVAELQAEIDALRMQLGIGDTADIGDSITALQAELKRLQDEAQARMDAEQAAKDKAMAAEARKLALGLDAASHFADGDTLTVTAMHGKPAGATSTIASGDNPNFMAKYSKSLGAMNGWSGTELMSMADNGPTDVMHVYTNVDAGMQIPFAEWAAATTDVTFAGGAVTNPGVAANAMYVAGAAFATGSGSKTHEANRDTDPNTAGLETFQTSGTFAGASGTYSCTGACSSAVAGSDGGVILTGTWVFTPNNGAMAHQADSEYQHFGWWLRKADTGYTVHAFAGSTGDTAISDITAVGGTATYTGRAAGKYNIYDSGPKGGHFTAMVELKADFGSTTTLGTISGMVDNFMGDTAGMDTWSVTLPELPLVAAGTFAAATVGTPADAEKTTWSIDGEAGAQGNGEWGGSLRSADTGGTPQVAIGTFSAEYGVVGNMRGAFGATRSGP